MSETDTPEDTPKAKSPAQAKPKKKLKWRPWIRALHRDIGYFAIGLTVIYALSGLAVNHIADWDPNFTQIEQRYEIGPIEEEDEEAIGKIVAEKLKLEEKPQDVYRVNDDELEVSLPSGRTLQVNQKTGAVLEQGQEPRFFLRVANWLHLNRGKKAWSYIADGYAVFLLYLAISGLFMIPGRKGLLGRGAVIAILGALVPVLYVTLSGGP
ncbi:MAG: PepSY-associated TM helix domain-containing protein [Polyangiaceae bacterium]|nr:PepSY-associated TM helix domain-containing protein [Polyangiaceae bacterium]MCB9608518.1 PepSY-associated TM helix domain-containing protein [Polyangiaceae bacterium]